MIEQDFILSTLQKNISPGFVIRQIKIENPTPFYIYLNLSSAVPTNLNATHTIQPNTTFISPAISTTDICVVSAALDTSRGIPKLTAYDAATQPSGNTPYQTPQYVGGFPNYPYTIDLSQTGSTIGLPNITIDKFQTLFLLCNGINPVNPGFSSAPFFVSLLDDVTEYPLGMSNPNGSMFSFIPSKLPQTVTPQVYQSIVGGVIHYAKEFTVIQSPQFYSKQYNLGLTTIAIANGGNENFYGISNPPGFIINLDLFTQSGLGFTANVPIVISIAEKTDFIYTPIYSTTFRGFVPNLLTTNSKVKVFSGKIFIRTGYETVKVNVTNNSGVGNNIATTIRIGDI